MASIELKDVIVDFPIYNANTRSFKNTVLKATIGGKVDIYEQNINIRALDGIAFTLKDGDRLGLVGHNGAGKSTLLRLLGKVYIPCAGTARIEGSIGSLIAISLGIDQEATGRENIYIRGSLLGLKKQEIEQKIGQIIELCDLGSFIDLPIRTYSTGMQMRLAFAVSTMIRPDILIMDEWLSVGDESFRSKAESRMVDLVNNAQILIIASHSKELIKNTCNRVIWLEHGKIKMDGTPEDVLTAYFG
ncbi:ABC transporter ATP-binding protein [Bilophila wadsworthia]|jgi:ABC transporter related|uniref:ABC transporter ATP-binding protein n=1 Tax=Bilophila wadsworthia TaxID=35833 RepID=UPI0024307AB9|nr:ABC transporter ATP-binding protein [Bilophila wadsworthia]